MFGFGSPRCVHWGLQWRGVGVFYRLLGDRREEIEVCGGVKKSHLRGVGCIISPRRFEILAGMPQF